MNSEYNNAPLLLDEPPLQVLPSLAVLVGLEEAITSDIEAYRDRKTKRQSAYFSEAQIQYLDTLGVTLPELETFQFWFEVQAL